MVRERSTSASRSVSGTQDDSESSNPQSSSIEDPPTYEESLAEDWKTNLTWPNTLSNRDELSQILHVNNYDYSTRGRAFTVSGPAESHTPRYRNIINYFENSLDDISSVDWSGQSIHRSFVQMPRNFSGSEISLRDAGGLLTRTKSIPGPKPHNIGTRSSSRDVIHWEYINEINPNTRTRFTVRVVPTTDEPPNYSFVDREGVVATPAGVVATPAAADRDPLSVAIVTTPQITTPQALPEDKRPSPTTGSCNINTDTGPRQPSAPSLDQINQDPMTDPSTCRNSQPARHQAYLDRIVTAPARLQDKDSSKETGKGEGDPTNKAVSFYIGDENSNPNIEGIQQKIEEEEKRVFGPSSERQQQQTQQEYTAVEKKEARTSETGDSGYGDDSAAIYSPSDSTLPLHSYTSPLKHNLSREEHIVHFDHDDSKSKLLHVTMVKLMPSADSPTPNWENHRLFRHEDAKDGVSWKFWLGVVFFLCDVMLVVVGALLLILNYHGNVILGFSLLGVGIGMCIPALNYIGGFPTVCAGVATKHKSSTFNLDTGYVAGSA